MAAIVGGDRAALARLIALYGPGVRRYAAQTLVHPADAEDVAQEVFLRVWRKAGSFDPNKGAVSSWLYRIAINLCIDHNRRGRFRQFIGLEAVADPVDETPLVEEGLAARQRLSQVQRQINALPERQRRALVLRAAGELSTSEIALVLKTSEGAVEQLLVRARATLRRQIEKEE